MRIARIGLLAALSLGLTGCWFKKKKPVVPTPPPPVAAKPEPVKVTPKRPDPVIPDPPKVEPPPPSQVTLPAPEPQLPQPPRRRRPARKSAPVPLGTPQLQPAPPPSAPAPQLGEILTPERRREYEAAYAQSLARARAALARAAGRTLDAAQRETAERIQTFIAQAEEAKARDLATAMQLIRRADVLGQDLLNGLP
jgi:hypothetical protein